MKVFMEGIHLVINFWWEIQSFLKKERGGIHSKRKVDELCHSIFSWFIESKKEPLSLASAKITLPQRMFRFVGIIGSLDDSVNRVCELLWAMYEECNTGDFTSVDLIKEVNLSLARRLMQKQVCTSSNMNGYGGRLQGQSLDEFREGVDLVMEKLWVGRVFSQDHCGPNPHDMLEDITEELVIWFNQTKKLISEPYVEWILRNILYPLPIHVEYALNRITKEIAADLMTMFNECSRGEFKSVEKLKEEKAGRSNIDSKIEIGYRPLSLLMLNSRADN